MFKRIDNNKDNTASYLVNISLTLMLSAINYAVGMSPDTLKREKKDSTVIKHVQYTVNQQDRLGNTLLHFTVLSAKESDRLYPQYAHLAVNNRDETRAGIAARLILKKANVAILNEQDLSPVQIAAANVQESPQTHAVLEAGTTVQFWTPYIPDPANDEYHTWQDLWYAIPHPVNKQLLARRSQALTILEHYASK